MTEIDEIFLTLKYSSMQNAVNSMNNDMPETERKAVIIFIFKRLHENDIIDDDELEYRLSLVGGLVEHD